MLTAALFASSLLGAQPAAPAEQGALAECLGRFITAQQQAGAPVADFTSALANACYREERAYRDAHRAAATGRGASYLEADTAAYEQVFTLRNRYRDTYLAAQTGCGPDRR